MENDNQLRVKILVVAHKEFDDSIIPDEGYQVIKVGSRISSTDALSSGWLTDDTGENIADQNPYYCELTAHYWAWKNLKDVDVVGLVHYRRFFIDYQQSSIYKENILTKQAITRILSRKRVIMPFQESKNGYFYLNVAHPNKQQLLWIIREIIKKYYPIVLPSYDTVVGSKVMTLCNMAIFLKSDFDDYSSFLFDVMDKFNSRMNEENRQRVPRCNGYLGEVLLPVWVKYRFKESEIYRLDVRNSESTATICPKTIIGRFRTCHTLLSLVRYFQIQKLKFL